MRDEAMHDQERMVDPAFRAALRHAAGEPPLEEVDWDALRSSIGARAALPLARRRAGAQRSGTRWARALIPLAAAASVALAVWLGGAGTGEPDAGSHTAAAPAAQTPEEVLRLDVSEQEFRQLVSGRADPEALLMLAVGDS